MGTTLLHGYGGFACIMRRSTGVHPAHCCPSDAGRWDAFWALLFREQQSAGVDLRDRARNRASTPNTTKTGSHCGVRVLSPISFFMPTTRTANTTSGQPLQTPPPSCRNGTSCLLAILRPSSKLGGVIAIRRPLLFHRAGWTIPRPLDRYVRLSRSSGCWSSPSGAGYTAPSRMLLPLSGRFSPPFSYFLIACPRRHHRNA